MNKNITNSRRTRLAVFTRLATLICLTALTLSGCSGVGNQNEAGNAGKSDSVSKSESATEGESISDNENVSQGETGIETENETDGEAGEISYEQISQEEAKNLMDTETDVIILDVRTEEEYAGGHIAGAICIPNETIDDSVTEQLTDKEQLILVYCRSGNRSKQASEKLVAFGYTNIKEFGGINTWQYDIE